MTPLELRGRGLAGHARPEPHALTEVLGLMLLRDTTIATWHVLRGVYRAPGSRE